MNAVATAETIVPLPTETLDGWVEDGLRLHRDGKLDDARAVYEAILAAQPDHVHVLSLLGLIHHQAGDSAAGAALIRRAVELAPETAILRDHLGLALDGIGDADGATESHAMAVIIDPRHAPGWYNLGMQLSRQSRDADALRCIMNALDLDPRNAIYRAGFGRILTGLGHYPEAADAFRLALLADPGFTEAYAGLAALWTAAGKTVAAAYASDAVQKLRDGDPSTLFSRTIVQHIDATFPTTLAH